ncbi:MAG TPA: DUF1501 domain-containing protein [Nitrospiraceae bacterium]|nr:DUF1501 domain-containing protein [Nitrospiraceae bacterium]
MPEDERWQILFPRLSNALHKLNLRTNGVQPGRIIGRTDSAGGLPETEAYTPADLAATMFHCLGIGPDREFHDLAGRPYRIYHGQPIQELL